MEVREEITQTKQSSEQLMDTLRARMEECDVRIAEIKDAYEFKHDIVTGRTRWKIAERRSGTWRTSCVPRRRWRRSCA